MVFVSGAAAVAALDQQVMSTRWVSRGMMEHSARDAVTCNKPSSVLREAKGTIRVDGRTRPSAKMSKKHFHVPYAGSIPTEQHNPLELHEQ